MKLTTTEIARVCHEVNRAYCAALGDNSQPAWEDAPDWQRGSAINGVSYTLAHPEAKPSDSHEEWLKEKTADGWRWGAVKDPVAKTHPCFLPYDLLPAKQRAKDYIFQAVVRALAPPWHAAAEQRDHVLSNEELDKAPDQWAFPIKKGED